MQLNTFNQEISWCVLTKFSLLFYRLVLASKAASSLKNVASFVVGLGEGMEQPTSKVDEMRSSTDDMTKAEFSNIIT